tara:strand:+ start:4928 stop:5734 length:807 start_codon:yes stop_codon:yes gene_type:complete
MSYFKSNPNPPVGNIFEDRTDAIAEKSGLVIEILHVPSNEVVKFKAFLTQFDDQYQTEFAQEQVYGRMDAIQSYRGTTRQINLAWDVPSSSIKEAEDHMARCSTLMNMLYPVYSKAAGKGVKGKVMSAPPIFKIKFANLIANTHSGTTSGGVESQGLFGTISGFSYAPDLDSGFFNVGQGTDTRILPQTISLSCMFTVIHTHDLGWNFKDKDKKISKAESKYPYGLEHSESSKANKADPPKDKKTGRGAQIAKAKQNNATNQVGGTKK